MGSALKLSGGAVRSDDDEATSPTPPLLSLAGDHLIAFERTPKTATMILRRISNFAVNESYSHSEGATAWACLHGHVNQSAPVEPEVVLTADFSTDPPAITASTDAPDLEETIGVLSKILAQWGLGQFTNFNRIRLLDGSMFTTDDSSTEAAVCTLFGCTGEVVEMVDCRGSVIARVPRPLVHRHNLLHRGIGLFVTSGTAANDDATRLAAPECRWYVHRRTATKRIFPSLYDMFVGGISLAGEDARTTALREVREELGLSAGTLTDPLLTCIVCTGYNRCVVTLFAYLSDPDESITWQAEEVAWGKFCSYRVISEAADRSIQRLIDGKEWPGCLPVKASGKRGSPVAGADDAPGTADWLCWDFVPDGLLVWVAWLNYVESQSRITASC